MLAGMLFAIRDAEDRPDRLAATLPFAGATLIEYQARLLVAAGASQIVIVVARLTPDLLGAIGRIGKRGVAVDAVRNAEEAAEKLHPLSHVLVLADGLVTTEANVRLIAGDGGDTLFVLGEDEAGPSWERIGGKLAWAGMARLAQARLRDLAAMPPDYDLQSALLRVASQAGAVRMLLPPAAIAEGHGIEHRAVALDARGRALVSASISSRRGWFDRWIVAPLARLALPGLVTRGVPSIVPAIGGAALGAAGLASARLDLPAAGLGLTLAALLCLSLGGALASLRDERRLAHIAAAAGTVLPALAALLLAGRLSLWSGEGTAIVLAIGLVVVGGLGERAIAGRERMLLWGSPGAYLLVLLAGALAAAPLAGLAAGCVYASATLALAIETLRRHA